MERARRHHQRQAVDIGVEPFHEPDVGLRARRIELDGEGRGVRADDVLRDVQLGKVAAELLGLFFSLRLLAVHARKEVHAQRIGRRAHLGGLVQQKPVEPVQFVERGEVECILGHEPHIAAEFAAREIRFAAGRLHRHHPRLESLGEPDVLLEARAIDRYVHRRLGADGFLQPVQGPNAVVTLRKQRRDVGVHLQRRRLAQPRESEQHSDPEHHERVPDAETGEPA